VEIIRQQHDSFMTSCFYLTQPLKITATTCWFLVML
jgi:hypothetical protein